MKKNKQAEFKIDGQAESAVAVDTEAFLRGALRDAQSDNALLRERLGAQKEFADQVAAAVVAMPPVAPYTFRPAKRSSIPATAVIKFSDWHIGEVTNPKETEGFGRYNWAIAQQRIHSIVDSFLKWVEMQRGAYRITRCVVFSEGDYISGDIHQELMVTNEFPLPVQTAKAGHLLGEMLHRLSGRFEVLEVKMVGADNHGRLTRKPQAKQKSSNNMSFLVHRLAEAYVERCTNVRCETAEGMRLLANIEGWRFLIEHGDVVRGWGGLPYYGFGRQIGKEAKRRMNTDLGFHFWSIGHFHVPAIIDGTQLVNGSLSGTSEFDHACGRHAPPSQVAFLVHPRHGVFNWVPFSGGL